MAHIALRTHVLTTFSGQQRGINAPSTESTARKTFGLVRPIGAGKTTMHRCGYGCATGAIWRRSTTSMTPPIIRGHRT